MSFNTFFLSFIRVFHFFFHYWLFFYFPPIFSSILVFSLHSFLNFLVILIVFSNIFDTLFCCELRFVKPIFDLGLFSHSESSASTNLPRRNQNDVRVILLICSLRWGPVNRGFGLFVPLRVLVRMTVELNAPF